MNTQKIIGITILVGVALLGVTVGVVFAAGQSHQEPPFSPAEEGEFIPYRGHMHDRWGGWSSETAYPPMHEDMIQAVADATGLTTDEIESRLDAGEHLVDIALDAGLTEEAFFDLMAETREAFLEEALENGWITEEHFAWMLEHHEDLPYGYGFGGCHQRYDQEYQPSGGGQHGRGRRW